MPVPPPPPFQAPNLHSWFIGVRDRGGLFTLLDCMAPWTGKARQAGQRYVALAVWTERAVSSVASDNSKQFAQIQGVSSREAKVDLISPFSSAARGNGLPGVSPPWIPPLVQDVWVEQR